MGFALNKEQRAAVEALRGDVLIGAGAGSGKTRTLTERFVRALSDVPGERWMAASASQILTITFTEKAAGELAERIRLALRAAGRDAEARAIDAAWIDTIHGFCSRILRRYALEAGVDPGFAVADTVQAGLLKREAFEEAARRSIERESGRRLFGEFGYSAVFDATETIARELRTRGLQCEVLIPESAPDVHSLLREAVSVFGAAQGDLAACCDSTASAQRQVERCESVLSSLASLEDRGLKPGDLGEAVWRALAGWTPERPTKKTAEFRERLKRAHARLLARAAACAATPFAVAMHDVVDAYERNYTLAKDARGLLDFDDLQTRTLSLLTHASDVLEACRREFRMVMVDEFQDTDALQSELVRLVSPENLCTVGDERQSIYRFRGADVGVYRARHREMLAAGGREFELQRNYRSHPDLLAFVNALFGNELLFGDDLIALQHGRNEPEPPVVGPSRPRVDVSMVHRVHGSSETSGDARAIEAALLARRLAELRDQEGTRPTQMAVLLRSYRYAETYAAALRDQGLEALVVGGSRFFDVPEVRTMRMFLRAVGNPDDESALLSVLASPLARMSDDALWQLRHGQETSAHSLWAAIEQPGTAGLSRQDADAASAARALVERARERVGQRPLSEVLLRAVEESDLDLILLARGTEGRQGYGNVLKLARMADAFEATGEGGPAAFEAYLGNKEELNDHASPATLADAKTPAVRLMSIHQSKGLEFPVVAVVGLGEREPSDGGIVRTRVQDGRLDLAVRLPRDWADREGANRTERFIEIDEADKAASLEERKRLFYVACTRAEDVLLLSGVGDLDKECAAEVATTPLDWLRAVLGAGAMPVAGECRDTRLGEARVRVARTDAGEWAVRAAEPDRDIAQAEGTDRPQIAEPDAADPPAPRDARRSGRDGPARVSYSDLALFLRCRRRYYYERLLGIGRLGEQGKEDPREFGSAVHAVLQLTDQGGGLPDDGRRRSIARYFGLGVEGLGELQRTVERFSASDVARELKAFSPVRREWPFAIRLIDEGDPFLLVGTIDAYGRTDGEALIVDYKTGESGAAHALFDRYRLQARCYALAALRDGATAVRVVFVRPEVVDSDGTMQRVRFEFGQGDAAGIEAEVVSARNAMSQGRFEALETWCDAVCADCPVAGTICDVARDATEPEG